MYIQSAHDDSATFHIYVDVCADMYVRVCMCGSCAVYVRELCAGCMCGYGDKIFPFIIRDFLL